MYASNYILALYGQAISQFTDGMRALIGLDGGILDSGFVSALRSIGIVLTVGLIIAVIVITRRLRAAVGKVEALEAAPSAPPIEAAPLQQRWDDILHHLDSTREGEWKYSVVEADKLVDNELKKRFGGEMMGERLMTLDKTRLLTIDGVWEAHKIRNRLIHDANYFLRHAEAVRAVKLFEQTLKELQAL